MPTYHPRTGKYYCDTATCNEESSTQCERCAGAFNLRYCGRTFCAALSCPCGTCNGKCGNGQSKGCCCPRCHLINFGMPQVSALASRTNNTDSNSNNHNNINNATSSIAPTENNNATVSTSTDTGVTSAIGTTAAVSSSSTAPAATANQQQTQQQPRATIQQPSNSIRVSGKASQQQQQQQSTSNASRGARVFVPFEYDPIIG